MAAIQNKIGYGKHNSAYTVRSCWKQNLAQMDAGFKELEHRWEEQQLHIRKQAQQIQDTEYLGLDRFVSVCVCELFAELE